MTQKTVASANMVAAIAKLLCLRMGTSLRFARKVLSCRKRYCDAGHVFWNCLLCCDLAHTLAAGCRLDLAVMRERLGRIWKSSLAPPRCGAFFRLDALNAECAYSVQSMRRATHESALPAARKSVGRERRLLALDLTTTPRHVEGLPFLIELPVGLACQAGGLPRRCVFSVRGA